MDELPGLDRFGVAEKDELIRRLWAHVGELTAQVGALQAKVLELEARLAPNSRNSSKPPSSDGLNKPKPKSLRKPGERPTGGQKGHKGHTLDKVAEPDRTVQHAPSAHCDTCQSPLPEAKVAETRQVFDLPALAFEVTEHQVLAAPCAVCGKICRGEFPDGIFAPVQYGPAVMAAVVHLTHHHMMPVQRRAALMGDFFGLPMAQATMLTYIFEKLEQAWAGRMIDLLVAACRAVNEVGSPLPAQRIADFRTRYAEILAAGEAVNPLAPKSGKRGRTRQSKAANLLLRLRTCTDDVWRFATDHNISFTNNLAEQAVRMPMARGHVEVKQKISGGFRTKNGADTFCTIRSYLATMHKQRANLFHALILTFQGQTPQPRFA